MRDFPSGYRLYADVVNRLGECVPVGGGLTFQCLLPERHRNGDRHPSCRCWIGARGELRAKCMGCGAHWRQIVDAVGLPAREWFPQRDQGRRMTGTVHPAAKLVAEYAYRDAAGAAYATKRKFAPGFHGRPKDFAWSRPVPEEIRWLAGLGDDAEAVVDGPDCLSAGPYVPAPWRGGGYHFRRTTDAAHPKGVLLAACVPGLYGMDRLHAGPGLVPGVPVLIVEGEKDADVLARLGFCAVSGPCGSSNWPAALGPHFADRHCVIVPDNDAPGLAHAAAVAGSLVLSGASSIRVLRPGEGGYCVRPGGDVTDWLRGKADPDRDPAAARAAIVSLVRPLGRYSFGQVVA